MSAQLIIEIAHENASPCLMDGSSVSADPEVLEALSDCARPGDVESACDYVLRHVGVEFRIVARRVDGTYENRVATAAEKADTCRRIYFESGANFDHEPTAELYLVWQAANELLDNET